jgi:peptide/nickel transport system permease protein
MVYYIVRRLLMLIPTLVGITFVSFFILQLVPGDPARVIAGVEAEEEVVEALRESLGLRKPIIVQYWIFLKNVMEGDFGESIRTKHRVIDEVWPRFLNTVKLSLVSIVIAFVVGITIGTIAGVYRNSSVDYLTMVLVLLGISTPTFWSGLIFILIFSVYFGWFPAGGFAGIHSIVLPAITLAAGPAAMTARMARASILDVLRQDYIKTALAKGLRESKVIYKHALRNALIPTVTIIGLQFGYLIGGSVLVETIFTWPGLGRLIVQSIDTRDYPVVQGGVLIFASSFVFINLAVDILYTYLDPRVTYE